MTKWKNFKEDPNHRFEVIEYRGPHRRAALRVELALIESNPSQPVLHALSWASPPGTGSAAGMINQRTAAFERRLRDLQTGEVIATFADRNMQDAGPLDVTRLTCLWPRQGHHGPLGRIVRSDRQPQARRSGNRSDSVHIETVLIVCGHNRRGARHRLVRTGQGASHGIVHDATTRGRCVFSSVAKNTRRVATEGRVAETHAGVSRCSSSARSVRAFR